MSAYFGCAVQAPWKRAYSTLRALPRYIGGYDETIGTSYAQWRGLRGRCGSDGASARSGWLRVGLRTDLRLAETLYARRDVRGLFDAIERRNWPDLKDELGDMLLQVLFYAQMADEAGYFTIEDVVRNLSAKLVRRHPHIFGDAVAHTAADVSRTVGGGQAGGEGRAAAAAGQLPERGGIDHARDARSRAAGEARCEGRLRLAGCGRLVRQAARGDGRASRGGDRGTLVAKGSGRRRARRRIVHGRESCASSADRTGVCGCAGPTANSASASIIWSRRPAESRLFATPRRSSWTACGTPLKRDCRLRLVSPQPELSTSREAGE